MINCRTSAAETTLALGATHPGLTWFFVSCHWREPAHPGCHRWFGHIDCLQDVDADLFGDDE